MSVQPVSEQVLALVHTFTDEGRRQGVRDLAATVAALEERVAELEAPIDGLLGWFAQHARLCGAQEWIDRLNALAPTEEGGRDA